MVVLTEKAVEKIKAILAEEKKENYGLRVFVSGGGCHGFQYGMVFEEQANGDDTVIQAHGVRLFIDAQSAPMLQGTEVDYVGGLQESGFSIKNPQAQSSCGCGNSFSA